MDFTLAIITSIVIGYLIGSIPIGILCSKMFFGFDIRTKGSGNMGSTNVFRVMGTKWGIIVQILDLAKGYLPTFFILMILKLLYGFTPETGNDAALVQVITGLAAVLGHLYPLFAGFKGGKGVNTSVGMLLVLVPTDIGIAFLAFSIVVIFSGFISLGSLAGAVVLPSSILVRSNIFGIYIHGYEVIIYFCILVSLMVIIKHRSNIKRLISGDENRFTKLQLIKCRKTSSDNT